ncbi:MAG TPA: CsgG/HfaB family protein [Gemmatimonadaceae bacterium]|nr:CsgG/HfaB family protein [Gemmatimonadaceae bacterium]
MQRRLRVRPLVLAAALLCAPAAVALHAQAAGDPALTKLEQRVARDPNSAKAQRALGVKYFELKRFGEAKAALDKARAMDPKDGVSALYAGMSAEALNDFAGARDAYSKYLEVGKSKATKKQINERLVAMARDELKAQAKQAVANEARLRGVQSPSTTVAVLPFHCACTDTALKPLERGMADLVVTDLARASALKVLERDRMQAIVDEIKLSQTAQADPATATRAGKLIAAGSILTGQIVAGGGTQMNLAGAVVNTTTSQPTATPTADGTINAIFDTERKFVLDVFREMNVTLTPDEAKAFEQRRVPSFQAFLAYSRGLMAEDDGRLDDAIALFESARSLDPGFGAALQRAQSAAAAKNGAQVSSASVQQGLKNTSEGQVVSAAQRGSTTDVTINLTLNNVVGDVNPTLTNTVQNGTSGGANTSTNTPQNRDATADATGTDQPAQKTGQITIVIKKP